MFLERKKKKIKETFVDTEHKQLFSNDWFLELL